jgi:tetratricopeptide (TPR) repeat protein
VATLASINNMGDLLRSQGKLVEAEPFYREALEISRRVLGDDRQETLIYVKDLYICLVRSDRYDEARAALAEFLAMTKLSSDHANVLAVKALLKDLDKK